MSSTQTVLHDPTSESASLTRPRTPPLPDLEGRTVALFDIGKLRSDEFLDAFGYFHLELLCRHHVIQADIPLSLPSPP